MFYELVSCLFFLSIVFCLCLFLCFCSLFSVGSLCVSFRCVGGVWVGGAGVGLLTVVE